MPDADHKTATLGVKKKLLSCYRPCHFESKKCAGSPGIDYCKQFFLQCQLSEPLARFPRGKQKLYDFVRAGNVSRCDSTRSLQSNTMLDRFNPYCAV